MRRRCRCRSTASASSRLRPRPAADAVRLDARSLLLVLLAGRCSSGGPVERQDGADRQRAGARHVQRGSAHPVAHQLRVHQEGLSAQHPQIWTQWRTQDVHVPRRVSVSPGLLAELS